jgi:L-iditol 2-dehydrogenase
MNTMNVAMYYSNNDVRIEEMPIPEIQDDELLIKVKASGICGSDVMEWYRLKKAPLVLGHEISGDVVKTGKNVTTFQKDDRVFVTHHVPCNTCHFCLNNQHSLCDTLHHTKFYPGGFAEYLRVPSINVDRGTFLLPQEISYEEGTFIEPLACVVRGFRIAEFKPPGTVLILGCGIAGLLNIKLAQTLGATRIIATDINPYRLKMAEKIGADYTFNAKENIPEKIKKSNEGELADFVILCAGVSQAAQQAITSTKAGGILLLFAPTEPGITIPLDLFDIWNKQIKIISTYAGAPKDIKDAIQYLQTKIITITDLITHKLPLKEASQGFKIVAQAQESMKVILQP